MRMNLWFTLALIGSLVFPSIGVASMGFGAVAPLNTIFATDGASDDDDVSVATDGSGKWIAVWRSENAAVATT
jgi:hypothetical protein